MYVIMRYNPFEILCSVDDGNWPEGVDVYSDAIQRFDVSNPEPLAELLRSNDPVISHRGLVVFGDLGKKAFSLVDLALQLNSHPHAMARNALMNGIISYSAKLSPDQAQNVLMLADDSDDGVRSKVITFIAASKADSIFMAIKSLVENDVRLKHLTAFEEAASNSKNVHTVFEQALFSSPIQSTYLLAMLERAARDKEISEAPIYSGNDYIGESVSANIKRILRRNRKQKQKKGSESV